MEGDEGWHAQYLHIISSLGADSEPVEFILSRVRDRTVSGGQYDQSDVRGEKRVALGVKANCFFVRPLTSVCYFLCVSARTHYRLRASLQLPAFSFDLGLRLHVSR